MSISHEHAGWKISAKITIYNLSRAKLLCSLCNETPCILFSNFVAFHIVWTLVSNYFVLCRKISSPSNTATYSDGTRVVDRSGGRWCKNISEANFLVILSKKKTKYFIYSAQQKEGKWTSCCFWANSFGPLKRQPSRYGRFFEVVVEQVEFILEKNIGI